MSLLQIANHPLLQTRNLVKVIKDFDVTQDDFALVDEMPVREIKQTRVAYDIRKSVGGMTQAAKAGAESPTVSFYGAAQAEFEPAEWREKVLLSPEEMLHLRDLGTENEVETIQSVIARHMTDLNMRLENRLEWARWQALLGSLTHVAKDMEYNVDYKIPADLKPTLTGADLWTASTSDPMDDTLEWCMKYRELVANEAGFWFNRALQRTLLQSSKIRTLRDALFTGQPNLGQLSPENLQTVFAAYTAIPYNVYDGGYVEITDLTTAVASSGTSLVCRNIGTIAVGDAVILTDVASDVAGRCRVTVSGIAPTTNTLTIDSPGTDRAYPVGSTVRVKKHFIADNKFIIRGQLPASIEGGPNWAEIISTLHSYGPDPRSPQSGKFVKVLVEDGDPPKIQIIVGMRGLPVVYHRDVNVIATVA